MVLELGGAPGPWVADGPESSDPLGHAVGFDFDAAAPAPPPDASTTWAASAGGARSSVASDGRLVKALWQASSALLSDRAPRPEPPPSRPQTRPRRCRRAAPACVGSSDGRSAGLAGLARQVLGRRAGDRVTVPAKEARSTPRGCWCHCRGNWPALAAVVKLAKHVCGGAPPSWRALRLAEENGVSAEALSCGLGALGAAPRCEVNLSGLALGTLTRLLRSAVGGRALAGLGPALLVGESTGCGGRPRALGGGGLQPDRLDAGA